MTTGYEDADDLSLLDLFQVELETNARVLDTGLVNLEDGRSSHSIEPLMRAAHSIKGAARIVGLDGAVSLAHAMEDLLEAARKERLQLGGDRVDILLRANDIFLRLSTLNPRDIADALVREDAGIRETCARLGAALAVPAETAEPSPEPASQAMPVESGGTPSARKPSPAAGLTPPADPLTADPPREESSVRVLAENLNRIIGLAGESLVRAKSAKPLSTELFRLKNGYSGLAEKLEALLLSPRFGDLPESVSEIIGESLRELDTLQGTLVQHIEKFEHLSRRLEYTAERMYDEAVAGRMRPFSDCLHGYPRLVRDLGRDLGKKTRLEIEGASILVDRDILERLEAPLTHLIRNALDHGIETPDRRIKAGKPPEGKIVLEARHVFGMLNITIRDDGRGIDRGKLREKILREGRISGEMAEHLSAEELFDFLFLPGFSTAERVTEISGRGVGLDVVASMVHTVGGSVRVHSEEGAGTTFRLQLPLTLSVLRTLLVEIAGESYAIPLARIDRVLEVEPGEIKTVEDRQFCTVDGEHVGIIEARQALQLPGNGEAGDRVRIAIISDRLTRYGLAVDRFRGQRELVVRPLDPRLGKVPNISAGALLHDGAPTLIFDVDDLVRTIDNRLAQGRLQKVGDRVHQRDEVRKRVLVVDDSLTVRQVERKLLENRGYEVAVAVDGMDGWNTLQGERFDLVITDVDMPRMNGIDLVRRIKENPAFHILPVMIISYKDREEDRMRGLEAGANYYLTKSSFHYESLLDAVRDLIGEP
ncbi:MAG: hybrid sensor histidine kinase/response regulator [Candidatus Latescibacterota bacterium]